MVIKTLTGAITGIECRLITVEVDVSSGLPCVDMVGNLGNEVREARERVRVALGNNGVQLPARRITINLSPADIRKEGTAYDLPLAVALLATTEQHAGCRIDTMFIAGELGLNGEIKPVRGILPMTIAAKENGCDCCLLPQGNMKEAQAVKGICCYGFSHLAEIIGFLFMKEQERERWHQKSLEKMLADEEPVYSIADFADVSGQDNVKRAMEIAAAGFHNLLMIGPPGAGKTMAAKCLPSILPDMEEEEMLEVTKIYSVAGKLGENTGLVKIRPFVAPHHTVTNSAFAGGGRNPQPGLISQAHKGVLFLDEVVHFSNAALETLRQPLEDKVIHICRNGGSYSFPADFILLAAMNPCPCGYYPDLSRCHCTPEQVRHYLGKLSGPILDRMDLCVEAARLDWNMLQNAERSRAAKCSEEIREHVMLARELQQKRFAGSKIRFNAEMKPGEIRQYIELSRKVQELLEKIYDKYELSARGYHRLLKVARTIADLDGKEEMEVKHILEAVSYRGVEAKYWKP